MEQVKVSSYSPGRIRLRLDPESEIAPPLQLLLAIPAIHEVTFRKLTRSLLILFDAHRIDLDTLIRTIEDKFPDWSVERPGERRLDNEYPRNVTLGHFFFYMDRLDRTIHRGTFGTLDLQSVLLLAFLGWGLAVLFLAPVRPKWYDILKEVTALLRDSRRSYDL